MHHNFNRRRFLLSLLASPLALRAAAAPAQAKERLPAWTTGCLDIHHIATGRGSATLVIMPDGTSMLIDAGAINNKLDVSAAPKPNAERRPGQWMGRYIQRHLRPTGRPQLDYLLVTHIHPDHLGDVDTTSPVSAHGSYRLSGVTDVAEILPIGKLIDRGFPSYDFPLRPAGQYAENYFTFVNSRVQRGLAVEGIRAGSADQFVMRTTSPSFNIRVIAANGEVWTGNGDVAKSMFPPLQTLSKSDYPNENVCSIALKFSLGQFSYFTGGDLTSYTFDGDLPWLNVLGAAARVAGPVSVATADHHGMFDGLSAEVVRSLRPQAWIIPSWHISHPDMLQMERMLSQRLYSGAREVYATTVMKENQLANQRLINQMRSREGHIVVRVQPGGDTYTIYVTDNNDEEDTIKLISSHQA